MYWTPMAKRATIFLKKTTIGHYVTYYAVGLAIQCLGVKEN